MEEEAKEKARESVLQELLRMADGGAVCTLRN